MLNCSLAHRTPVWICETVFSDFAQETHYEVYGLDTDGSSLCRPIRSGQQHIPDGSAQEQLIQTPVQLLMKQNFQIQQMTSVCISLDISLHKTP